MLPDWQTGSTLYLPIQFVIIDYSRYTRPYLMTTQAYLASFSIVDEYRIHYTTFFPSCPVLSHPWRLEQITQERYSRTRLQRRLSHR
ncbi:hypothetical protein [Ktedonobacter robiniae]|uniref:hypothetical protein n=1 Tax=Ktedonobacter robiniae TaxID=2778365 RepID=UPI0019161A18|nr:hypothetical protein [Ktedonobacter robiniae]